MATKLKSDIIKYGHDSIRIDYLKVKKGNGKIYVEVALVGKDAQLIDKKSDYQLTSRFYGSKSHAQDIVVPVVKGIIFKLQRGNVQMEIEEVEALDNYTSVFITSLGQENIYFQIGGLDYFVKTYKNIDYFETPKWIKAKELKEMVK